MKKIFLLIFIVTLVIFIDGTLTHDIFEYRLDSFSKWATFILILGILISIVWPKSSKENNSLRKKT